MGREAGVMLPARVSMLTFSCFLDEGTGSIDSLHFAPLFNGLFTVQPCDI